jgi:hypothetical protein
MKLGNPVLGGCRPLAGSLVTPSKSVPLYFFVVYSLNIFVAVADAACRPSSIVSNRSEVRGGGFSGPKLGTPLPPFRLGFPKIPYHLVSLKSLTPPPFANCACFHTCLHIDPGLETTSALILVTMTSSQKLYQ